jgi:hypothetical protein
VCYGASLIASVVLVLQCYCRICQYYHHCLTVWLYLRGVAAAAVNADAAASTAAAAVVCGSTTGNIVTVPCSLSLLAIALLAVSRYV